MLVFNYTETPQVPTPRTLTDQNSNPATPMNHMSPRLNPTSPLYQPKTPLQQPNTPVQPPNQVAPTSDTYASLNSSKFDQVIVYETLQLVVLHKGSEAY